MQMCHYLHNGKGYRALPYTKLKLMLCALQPYVNTKFVVTYITFSKRGSHIADLFFWGGEVRNFGKHYSISFGPFEATQLIHITPCVLLTSVYSFLQPLYETWGQFFLWAPISKLHNYIYVTRSAKKVHKSLYAFTRTGPFYVERVTKSSNKQFLREGIFNILDTYIFILHNQKC